MLTVTPKRGRKRKNLVDDLQSSCGDSSKRRSTRVCRLFVLRILYTLSLVGFDDFNVAVISN